MSRLAREEDYLSSWEEMPPVGGIIPWAVDPGLHKDGESELHTRMHALFTVLRFQL